MTRSKLSGDKLQTDQFLFRGGGEGVCESQRGNMHVGNLLFSISKCCRSRFERLLKSVVYTSENGNIYSDECEFGLAVIFLQPLVLLFIYF